MAGRHNLPRGGECVRGAENGFGRSGVQPEKWLDDLCGVLEHVEPPSMGASRQRELVTLGGAYTRRLARLGGTQLSYQAEVRPIVFESDPLALTTTVYSGVGAVPVTFSESQATIFRCIPASGSYPIMRAGRCRDSDVPDKLRAAVDVCAGVLAARLQVLTDAPAQSAAVLRRHIGVHVFQPAHSCRICGGV